ncbi:DNA helicase [Caerostris darwini]|uniref:DNA helicase n=1 Tax=Caerostris darwini TaxID=1538125 RepID=A0AAV4WZP2_9ARAC|nr:DNA helicase [Caerostris darwini]
MGDLYKKVMKLRNSIADNDGLAPYMVFSNKNLLDIATHRPVSIESLSQIEGIPSARISKFGKSIITLVKDFCKEHGLKDDVFSTAETSPQIQEADASLMEKLNSSIQATYLLSKNGTQDLNAVASARSLSINTVVNHMIEAIKIGLPASLSCFGMSQEIFDVISKVIQSPPLNGDVSRLTPIKQLCPEYIEFNHIKVVIAMLSQKYGVNEIPSESNKHSPEHQSSATRPDTSAIETSPSIISKENNSNKRKESSYFSQSKDAPAMKKLKSSKLFNL